MKSFYTSFFLLLAPFIMSAQSFQELRPAVAGDINEMKPMGVYKSGSANLTYIDDVISDGDNTYVSACGSFDMDLYRPENFQIPEGLKNDNIIIDSLVVSVRAKTGNDWNKGLFFRLIIKSGGTVYTSEDLSGTSSYRNYTSSWHDNPATGSEWTLDDISDIQFGQENGSLSVCPASEQFRFSKTSVTIYYHVLISAGNKNRLSENVKVFYISESKELSVSTFFSSENNFRIELFTLTGSPIKKFEIKDATQNIYEYPLFLTPGIYVVTVSGKLNSYTQKIIVR